MAVARLAEIRELFKDWNIIWGELGGEKFDTNLVCKVPYLHKSFSAEILLFPVNFWVPAFAAELMELRPNHFHSPYKSSSNISNLNFYKVKFKELEEQHFMEVTENVMNDTISE